MEEAIGKQKNVSNLPPISEEKSQQETASQKEATLQVGDTLFKGVKAEPNASVTSSLQPNRQPPVTKPEEASTPAVTNFPYISTLELKQSTTKIQTSYAENDFIRVSLLDKNILIVFSAGEKIDVKQHSFVNEKTKIIYSERMIYLDDTAEEINAKIWFELKKEMPKVTYESIYSLIAIQKTQPIRSIYDDIIEYSKKGSIERDVFLQVATNLGIHENNMVEKGIQNREEYQWEEFQKLATGECLVPLGYQIRTGSKQVDTLLFPVYPNQIFYYLDSMELVPHQQDTLLSHGTMMRPIITTCLVDDVIDNSESVRYKWVLSTFFPEWKRAEQNVANVDAILKKADLVRPYYDTYYADKGFFSKVSDAKTDLTISYYKRGINSITFSIRSKQNIHLPLRVLFNSVHAVKNAPFIKLNDTESIYRLYTEENSAQSGEPLPYLPLSTISTLSRQHMRDLVFLLQIPKVTGQLIVSVKKNGDLEVTYSERDHSIDEEKVDEIMQEHLNAFIKTLNQSMDFTGFQFPLFTQLKNEEDIEINGIDYRFVVPYPSKQGVIKQKYLAGAFSTIDNQMDKPKSSTSQYSHLLFRRVSNYNYLQEIREKIRLNKNKQVSLEIVKKEIIKTYGISNDDLRQIVEEELNPDTMRYKKKSKQNENGIMCELNKDNFHGKLYFDFYKIPSFAYLKLLFIYVDSFMKWIQIESEGKRVPNQARSLLFLEEDKNKREEFLLQYEKEDEEENQTVNKGEEGEEGEEGESSSDEESEYDEEEPENKEAEVEKEEEYNHNETLVVPIDPEEEEKEEPEEVSAQQQPIAQPPVTNAQEASTPTQENAAQEEKTIAQQQTIAQPPVTNAQEASTPTEENAAQEEKTIAQQQTIAQPPVTNAQEASTPTQENAAQQKENDVQHADTFSEVSEQSSNKQKPPSNKSSPEEFTILEGGVSEGGGPRNEGGGPKRKTTEKFSFLERLKQRDPDVFAVDSQEKDKPYARTCMKQFQPVAITDQEKQTIDEEDKKLDPNNKSYDRSLKYRNQNYICPRYWNFNEDRSISETEINSRSLENFIMDRTKSVEANMKEGKYIYEINSAQGYTMPGFTTQKNKKGFCYPCCYKPKEDGSISVAHKRKMDECNEGMKTQQQQQTTAQPPVTKPNADLTPVVTKPNADLTPVVTKPPAVSALGSTNIQEFEQPDELNEIELDKIDEDEEEEGDESNPKKELATPDVTAQAIKEPQSVGTKERSTFKRHYIKQGYIFPIMQNRWGNLPQSVAELFRITSDHREIEMNKKTPLRQGVEQVENQTFLSCFADIYTYVQDIYRPVSENQGPQKPSPVPSVKEFKQILKEKITLDKFVRYQNSSLPAVFRVTEETEKKVPNYDQYRGSIFYKSLDPDDPLDEEFFKDTVDAYENFQRFLLEDDIVIDHHFLWDAVSTPDPEIIPNGLNLVILNIDREEKVEIICPPNIYSTHSHFDPEKKSWLLIRRKPPTGSDEYYYEPIYMFTRKRLQDYTVDKWLNIKNGLPFIVNFLKSLPEQFAKCSGTPSLPKQYPFQVLPLDKIVELLQEKSFQVTAQVVLHYKTIGIIVKKFPQVESFFIPCLHSTPLTDTKKIICNKETRPQFTNSYEKTMQICGFLQKQIKELGITPVAKVVDRQKKAAVGFLLLNRLYLPIVEEPVKNITDSLKTVESIDYLEAETAIYSNQKDEDRLKARLYNLEDNFYRVFQFEVRKRVNDPEQIELRNQVLKIVKDGDLEEYESTTRKRNRMVEMLKRAMKGIVQFQNMDPQIYLTTDAITSCNDPSSGGKPAMYCFTAADGKRRIFFPKKNLLESSRDNEESYYRRLADELVRNPRVRNLVLQPQLLFIRDSNAGAMKKNSNEMVIFESALGGLLKKELPYRTTHKEYHSKTVFGNVEPSKRGL